MQITWKGLTISPNPAHAYISVNLEKSDVWSIEIYNAMGLKIQSTIFETHPIVNKQQRIDILNLTTGVYFLNIGENVNKFVKY